MREHGIAGLRLRRRVRTTIPEPADQKVPDLLNRDFTADAPNQRYVGDITYLPLADGANLYLATVIDCFSRRLAGWAIAEHMRTELVADALTAARDTGARWPGRSSTPTTARSTRSKDFAQLCAEPRRDPVDGRGRHQRRQRAGRVVQRHPQARDVLQGAHAWPDEATCRREVFGWVTRYNTRRRHSYCGQQAPIVYEQQHTATLRLAA